MKPKTIAVMQPYFFPYLGYFQLIANVDKFIFLNDVNYIQKGWINRNRILLNGAPYTITIPLVHASQNKRICELQIAGNDWKAKLLRTVSQNYKRAPMYSAVYPLFETAITYRCEILSDYIVHSLKLICDYLGVRTELAESLNNYGLEVQKGEQRIIDICLKERASRYINAIGGLELYSPQTFAAHNIELNFLRARLPKYQQFSSTFTSALSILDVMMFNDLDEIRQMLDQFELLVPVS